MISPAKIIYQGKSFLVIEKRAGVASIPLKKKKEEVDLVTWLKKEVFPPHYFLGKEGDFSKRAGLVHRLDRETSGLLLVAKTAEAFVFLQNQFKERKVKKEYLLLVKGDIPERGSILAPIRRSRRGRRKFMVAPKGREAQTDYQLVRRYFVSLPQGEKKVFSLVKAFPITGRTHQIRVHFSYLGYPLWGDKIYGQGEGERLFLHASKLEFTSPEEKKRVIFRSPLPVELERVIKKLEGKKEE